MWLPSSCERSTSYLNGTKTGRITLNVLNSCFDATVVLKGVIDASVVLSASLNSKQAESESTELKSCTHSILSRLHRAVN